MLIEIKNRPLSQQEKMKFHENHQQVMEAYEYYTKRQFMRFDVLILEELIKVATPAQIIAIIKKYSEHYKYAENFTFFGYIAPIVKNQFKNRRGGKHSDNTR
ncbi:hypothetical protein U8V72_10900 [Priestia filamentosa]|uniref:hypothetical protein n=1 Tax=Priestia filamentosa TaxID=1402861 RepID=UPI0039783AA2